MEESILRGKRTVMKSLKFLYSIMCSKKLLSQWISLLCISFLLWLCLNPLEVRWADADVTLSWGIMAISAVAGVLWIIPDKLYGENSAKGNWSWLDALVAAGALYYVLRAWIGTEYPCSTAFLKNMEMVMLYFALRCLMSKGCMSSKWIMGGLMACAVYEVVLGVTQVMNGYGRHYLYLLTGTFQNPGPFSAFLMLGAIIGLAWIREIKKEWQNNLILAATCLILMLLPATWSRAAIVSLSIVGLWLFRRNYWKWRWFVWGGCMAICVVFYFIKKGSADGRMLIWTSALTTWSHHPWVGVGIGGFFHANSNGVAELYSIHPSSSLFISGGVTDYAFNDLLKVLVEQGIIGAILCVAAVGYIMYLLWQHSKPLFYGILSLLLFSMFSYPFELLPYRIIVVMVAAWVASEHGRQEERKVCYGWLVLSFLLLLPSYMIGKNAQLRYNADRDCQLFAGMNNEALIDDFYELLPLERDNPRFLFDFGKTLRIHDRYNDSNDMLRQGTLVSADPMFYILMGNNYKDMHCPDLAEGGYKKAFSVMPNRIYPLYQLMLLYKENDNIPKAKEYAKKVINFKEKISSPATKQMKEEANRLLTVLQKTRL